MYVYVYMQKGASEETTYSHPLKFSLCFFKKGGGGEGGETTKNLLVSQVTLNSFTTFHSNVKALFQLPRPFRQN